MCCAYHGSGKTTLAGLLADPPLSAWRGLALSSGQGLTDNQLLTTMRLRVDLQLLQESATVHAELAR